MTPQQVVLNPCSPWWDSRSRSYDKFYYKRVNPHFRGIVGFQVVQDQCHALRIVILLDIMVNGFGNIFCIERRGNFRKSEATKMRMT
ncbi:glycoside hydrolase family 13 protein [Medicago truncatula]|uniref:Glycoside hydrolase family 13 protein n=1 Tax=Medicago truncatula TaxID=3880 RepID=A0A072U1N3_MEDTR|nr:glycoside hydrolase family 13 protein [Medicago truncatula]